ncbi:hypothetical protein KY285_020286 [Solanum tuberosum]|nr:hypothetical protein KY285_020286 [Solanum tuberosum]
MKSTPSSSIVGSFIYVQTCTRSDISFAVGMLGRYQRLGVVDIIAKPLKIYCDNAAAVFFSKNDMYSKCAKHMELQYFIVKEEIQKQRVLLENIRVDLMIADPLTKAYNQRHLKNMFKE